MQPPHPPPPLYELTNDKSFFHFLKIVVSLFCVPLPWLWRRTILFWSSPFYYLPCRLVLSWLILTFLLSLKDKTTIYLPSLSSKWGVEAESFKSWYSWFLPFLPRWFMIPARIFFQIHYSRRLLITYWLNDFLSGNLVSFCIVSFHPRF